MKLLPDGLILLSGGEEVPRNNDVSYVFRQGSDFIYLTGMEEPSCHLLIDPKSEQSTLYIPRIDNFHMVWRGSSPGPAEAKKLYGITRAAYNNELAGDIKRARRKYKRVYANQKALKKFKKELRGLKVDPARLHDSLQDLRAVKSHEEIKRLKFANVISGRGHISAMLAARPGMYEYELQALFEGECRASGLRHQAYPSIVATGKNSAVLHYERNDAKLKSGDLILIDAGGESGGYAADITRTYPVGNKFSARQKDVYSIVLETQKKCIRAAKPGVTSAELHVLSMRLIAEGLRDLKLLKGTADGLVENGAVRLFYPHGLGHMLGLDVHDGDGGKRRKAPNPTKVPIRYVTKLEPGFVITVEPGIYFISALLKDSKLRKKHKHSVDFSRAETFLDFGGIRIEDDIVVRNGAPLNLTNVPKEIKDIEALRSAQ